jgi:hypothetical protein
MQRAALAVGAPIGRLFGFRPDYTPGSVEPVLATTAIPRTRRVPALATA